MVLNKLMVRQTSLPGDRAWMVLLAGFLFFVAVVMAAAGSGADMGFVYRIPGRDFTGHLAIYGTLAFLWGRGLAAGFRRSQWNPLNWSGRHWGLVVFVALEELSQIWWVHRTFSWTDMAGNAIGLWLGFGLCGWIWNQGSDVREPRFRSRRIFLRKV